MNWEQTDNQVREVISVPVRIAFKRISLIGSGTFGVVNLIKLHSVTLKEGKNKVSCKDGEIQEGMKDSRKNKAIIDERLHKEILDEGICVPVSGTKGLCQRRLVKTELAMKTITVKRKDNR